MDPFLTQSTGALTALLNRSSSSTEQSTQDMNRVLEAVRQLGSLLQEHTRHHDDSITALSQSLAVTENAKSEPLHSLLKEVIEAKALVQSLGTVCHNVLTQAITTTATVETVKVQLEKTKSTLKEQTGHLLTIIESHKTMMSASREFHDIEVWGISGRTDIILKKIDEHEAKVREVYTNFSTYATLMERHLSSIVTCSSAQSTAIKETLTRLEEVHTSSEETLKVQVQERLQETKRTQDLLYNLRSCQESTLLYTKRAFSVKTYRLDGSHQVGQKVSRARNEPSPASSSSSVQLMEQRPEPLLIEARPPPRAEPVKETSPKVEPVEAYPVQLPKEEIDRTSSELVVHNASSSAMVSVANTLQSAIRDSNARVDRAV